MGPGPLGPGKLLVAYTGTSDIAASMGPGPLGPGKWWHVRNKKRSSQLQWGRALSDPERGIPQRIITVSGPASMGPGPLGPGKYDMMVTANSSR